jgi:hypothetical protein
VARLTAYFSDLDLEESKEKADSTVTLLTEDSNRIRKIFSFSFPFRIGQPSARHEALF